MQSLVDFHCHLDLYPDFEDVVKESEKAGVYTLAVTTTPRAWQRNYDLTYGLRYVRPALGLHPQLVGKDTAQELRLWEKYLPQAKYIGEVGLDAGPDYFHTLDNQKQVFGRILTLCASEGGKIISVHAIRSVGMVLDMIETLLPSGRGLIVLHWFTGTSTQMKRAVKLGCYFSVNALMLDSKRGRSLLRLIPFERLLTETDGPFTSNTSGTNRPKDVAQVIKLIGELLDVSPNEAARKVAANLKSILEESQ